MTAHHLDTSIIKNNMPRFYLLIKIAVCILVIILLFGSGFNIYTKLALATTIYAIIFRLNPTYPVAIGLFFLVATPVLLELNRQDWSDRTVVYAFYFLAIGTVSALFEKNTERHSKNHLPRGTRHLNEKSKAINTQLMLTSSEASQPRTLKKTPLASQQPKPTRPKQEAQQHPRPKPHTKRKLIQG